MANGKDDSTKEDKKDSEKDEKKAEESEKVKDKEDSATPPVAQPAQPAQSAQELYGNYPPGQPPRPVQPMFTSEGLGRVLAIGLLIGIIILFIGAALTSGAQFIKPEDEDDQDLKRSLYASGTLVGSIGLLLMGIFIVLPMMVIKDLTDAQKTLLIIVSTGIIIGFGLLISSFSAF
jgi:hypothetical protein